MTLVPTKCSMKLIVMMKGLPASGKSTWAKEFIKEKKDWVRVNNDDLSGMLFGEQFAEGVSSRIDSIRKRLIEYAMEKKLNIVVDNTNLHPKHHEYLTQLVEEHNQAQLGVKGGELYKLEIKDFSQVSLSECLKRNKARDNGVPDKVIRMMYTQYILPNVPATTQDTTLPKAAVFDIDGTIARMTNRSPYDASKYYDDAPIEDMIELVKMYLAQHKKVIFLTGRTEAGRVVTVKWLKEKCGILPEQYLLLMRPNADKTPDFEYKEKIFNEQVKGKYYVPIWFEDRLRNVEMARNVLHINAVQVGDGDF